MTNKRLFSKAAAVLGILTLSLTSCSKDGAKDENPKVDDAKMLSRADVKTIIDTDDFSASFDTLISDFILNDGASGKSNKTNCFTVETIETGYTITFDNCSLDGGAENLSGTIEMKDRSTPDAIKYDVTWTNFAIDAFQINGTRTYILKDYINASQYAFQIYSIIKIKNSDGVEVTEEGTKRVDFMRDSSNETFSYSLTGDWTISSPDVYYTVAISNELEGESSCEYITKGVMDVGTENGTYTVDFGDGICDDKATIRETDGASITIYLKD